MGEDIALNYIDYLRHLEDPDTVLCIYIYFPRFMRPRYCSECHVLSAPRVLSRQVLLKAFLPNTRSSSATMRRTAASALTLICQYSRKPSNFSVWLIQALLGQ